MALSPSQAHVVGHGRRATLQKRWPVAADMMQAAVVYERQLRRDPGLSGRCFRFDDGVCLQASDDSPPDGGVGVRGS